MRSGRHCAFRQGRSKPSSLIRSGLAFGSGKVIAMLTPRGAKPNTLRDALSKASSLAAALEDPSPQNRRAVIANIVARIVLVEGGLKILLDRRALAVRLIGTPSAGDEFYAIEAPIIFRGRGAEMLLITKDDCSFEAPLTDLPLLKALARGHTWFGTLVSGRVSNPCANWLSKKG